ncbi:NAD-dependent epimerase/dehydratase family protein [Herbiconiux sp. SYSU D00978]|uniref:NAD-dependent epimerase/dehydratase family protein n=1 Tax=Herbiconiux sp. SYSU D00978 TaxID=2812562 RepID=UPI001A96839C|nr:NAD-dependent epimerase/dehydratase family protein [Herbiconiux sp. SYSU D00978]
MTGTNDHAAIGGAPRALVTGGAGFVGSHLCDALLDRGFEVICLDDLSSGTRSNVAGALGSPRFRLIEADVSAAADLDEPLDLVVHLAFPRVGDWVDAPLPALGSISAGTLRALDLARAAGARFVLGSTSEIAGDAASDTGDPREPYLLARRLSESLVATARARYGLDTTIVRIFPTYGPRMRPGGALGSMIEQARRGSPLMLTGTGAAPFPLCFVSDVVRGILAAADSPLPGPVEIGDPAPLPLAVVAQRVLALTGSRSTLGFLEAPGSAVPPRVADTTLAEKVLGWRPRVGLDEGLALTLDALEWRAGLAPAV